MIKSRFSTLIFTAVLLFVINGINQIDAKEFINEEFNIKFEYPDEWKSVTLPMSNFGIEYDAIPIAIFYPNPDPAAEFNYVSLTTYTNMVNLDQFEKTIRQELVTPVGLKYDIVDINKHQLDSGVIFVAIHTLYITASGDPLQQRNHILFHKDNIGYEIEYTLPIEIATKYATNIHNIINQIKGNITN